MAPSDFELSDWKTTKLPRLSQLDSLLRCLICKDFLKAPVITSCNHTFCSQCIRHHLMSVSRCPLCKNEQFESNLKRNILLAEIVACYESVRPDVIELATKREVREGDGGTRQNLPKPTKANKEPENEVIEVLDEPEADSAPLTPLTPPPGSVSCPICGEHMSAEFLQRKHLDECLSGKKKSIPKSVTAKRKRESISLFFQPRKKSKEVDHEKFYFAQADKHHHDTRKLPKLDFGSVTTPKLKEKLSALKLAVSGTRPQLELRYNQFYLLHNSNLDLSRPALDLELRQKLNQWEKLHLGFSAPVSVNTIFGDQLSHKSITDKDFPVGAWLEKFRDEFRELTRAARRSVKRKPDKEGEGKEGSENSKCSEKEKLSEKEKNSEMEEIPEMEGSEGNFAQKGPGASSSGEGNKGSVESATGPEEEHMTNSELDSKVASTLRDPAKSGSAESGTASPLELGENSFDFADSTLFIAK